MMNVIQIQDRLKSFSEDQLAKEMESPSGSAPQYLVLSEFNRRKRVKADYEQQQNAQQQSSTVAEDVLAASGMPQAGLGALAQNMAPKTDMVQNSGAAPQQTMPMPEAPDAMAEIDPSEGGLAAMAGGGSVKRMAKGGRTQVEYDGRGYFVFDNGEVKDALSRPVSEYLAEAVKASMNKSPDATTSTQSLSPTMADESPEAPTLESVLSSDRPFNPLELSTPQARDATPPDYGLGGERPDTLTEATAPAINQQQALIDAMSPAFDEFGGDPLARAEERSNLSGPSISDVSPTVDLDLTTDQRISQEDMAMAVPVPQGQPRVFAQPVGQTTLDESLRALQNRYDAAIDNAGSYDDLSPKERMGFAAELSMVSPDRVLVKDNESPENVSRVIESLLPPARPDAEPEVMFPAELSRAFVPDSEAVSESSDGPSKMEQMMQSRSVADNQGRPMGEAAAALAAMTGQASGKDPSDMSSGPTQGEKTFDPNTGEMSPALRKELGLAPTIEGEVEELNKAISEAEKNNQYFLVSTLTTKRDTLVKQLQGKELATDVQEAVGGALRTVGEYASDLGGLLATKYREIVTANIDPVKAAEILEEYAKSDQYKFDLRKQQAAERENTESAREQRLIDLSGKPPTQPGYDDYPMPASGTEANPIIMGDAPAGMEATRPKKRPEGLKPVLGDPKLPKPTTPTTPTTPTVGSGGLESELAKMLAAGEKRRSTEKWLSLARAGAELMKGRPDGFSKAIEVGTKSLQDSQDNYSADKLKILTLQQRIAAGKSKGSGGLTANQSISRGMEYIKLADDTLLQATMLKDTNPDAAVLLKEQATQYRQMGRSLIGVPIGESGVTKMDTPSKGSN